MVDTDSDEDGEEPDSSKYTKMRKHELRHECLKRNLPASGSVKILVKRLKENDEIARNVNVNGTEKLCESCEENPNKMHKSLACT